MGHPVRSVTLACYNNVDVGHLAKVALLAFYTTDSPFSPVQFIVLLEILHANVFSPPNSPVLVLASIYGSWQQN